MPQPRRPIRNPFSLITAAVLTALTLTASTLTACGSSTTATPSTTGQAIAGVDLRSICPATVDVQLDWYPSAEQSAFWQLLGPGSKVDAGAKAVTGPLYSHAGYTGIEIALHAGGPAIGYTSATAQLYSNTSLMLGEVDVDNSIQNSASNPTTAVFATLEISPQIIFWDRATYPSVHKIADLKAEKAKVLYYAGSAYMSYLIGSGLLDKSQVDGSYDGTPGVFVTERGKDAAQGFVTSEPYLYENEVQNWKRPVAYQLITDTGYQNYSSAVSVRSADLGKYSACLAKLVPVLQQADIDYLAAPATANELIVKADRAFGSNYDIETARSGAAMMKKLQIIGNGTDNTIGNFDAARVQKLIDIAAPIFAAEGKKVANGLTPDTVVTNKFIDPSIGIQ